MGALKSTLYKHGLDVMIGSPSTAFGVDLDQVVGGRGTPMEFAFDVDGVVLSIHFDVELFIKKRELVGFLKKLSIFRQVAAINEDSVSYNFNVLTDLDDEIIPSTNKKLKLTAYSLFNINEEIEYEEQVYFSTFPSNLSTSDRISVPVK